MKKRNYVKENAWQKEKYTLVKAYIDKQLGIELKEKLKNSNKTIASFITDNAKKYLNKQ